MNKKRNILVTLADENYIDQAKQVFSGAYHNAGWSGDYMLLCNNIDRKDKEWFQKKGIIVNEKNPPLNKEGWNFGNKEKRFPLTVSFKFYLFTPEFKKWKKVVFLDADTIIRGNLDKLKRKGKKHINLVNKARQFKNQKNLNYKESFSLARDWERKYYKEREIYMEYRDKLYYKKSGLRLGEEGAILLNKYYGKNTYAKGQVLSEENREIIESMSEIPFGDLVEGLNMYIDEGFGLKPS